MALDNIQIEGFKSIRQLNMDLSNLNILIGANGAGKTNFILVFKLLNEIIEGRLQNFVAQSEGANSFLYFGRKYTAEIKFRLQFGKNVYKVSLAPTNNDNLYFSEEICEFYGHGYDAPYVNDLGRGHFESKLEDYKKHQRVVSFVFNILKSWKLYHFHDTSESAAVKRRQNLYDNQILKSNAANIAPFLYRMKEEDPNAYDRIIRTVRLVAPFFDDFVFNPQGEQLLLQWQELGSESILNASSFSDGTLRFICLATLLLQPTLPSVILIDEPELGLHPYAISLLAGILRSISSQTQIIVSTQSVPLVNQFEPEDIVVVDREDKQSTFKRLSTNNLAIWLEDYSLGEIWEKNLIGGRP
jgi:predicted ATPase